MPGHPAVGNLEYNGYTFDGSAKVKVGVEPVRDEADRTVIHTRLVIDVEAVVAPGGGSTSDNAMDAIREKLCHDGGILKFSNKGFSKPINVNNGKVKDVSFGPKVQMLQWEPIGSALACAIKWRVTTCIPCCTATARYSDMMSMNYEVTYAISKRGSTTRTIAGHMLIAQTRTAAKMIPDSADAYRERFAPGAPDRFERTTNSWHLDKSKSRVDFTIVDAEIDSPNPYPVGIIHAEGTSRVSQNMPMRPSSICPQTTLSLTLERDRNSSGSDTWRLFSALVVQRIQAITAATGQPTILRGLSAEEELFGYKSSFTASFVSLAPFADLIVAGGLWLPLGTDWGLWKSSIANSMFSHRGNAGLRTDGSNDAIIDLCGSQSFDFNSAGGGGTYNISDITYTATWLSGFTNQAPPPNQSYLRYECWLEPKRKQPYARLSPLQPSEGSSQQGSDNTNQLDESSQSYTKKADLDDIIQMGMSGNYSAQLVGSAMRVGYPVPPPALRKIGRQDAIEVDNKFSQVISGNLFGIPVYEATWLTDYQLVNSPGPVTTPKNIQEKKDDEA